MFDTFEIEIQRPGKESTYLSLLSDCLLSAIFDGMFWVQKGTPRISIQTVKSVGQFLDLVRSPRNVIMIELHVVGEWMDG